MVNQPGLRMRVLILSLDTALLDQNEEGDTFIRLRQYQKACEYLGVLVPSTRNLTSAYIRDKIELILSYGKLPVIAYWRLYRIAERVCREKSVNLIVTNDAVLGALAIWLRRKMAVKIQISIFGLEIVNPHWLHERPQNIIFKWVQEWAIKRADSLRTDTFEDRQFLINRYKVPAEKIVVIPVAPSQERQKAFLSARQDRQLKKGLVGDKAMILAVGGLVKAKDYLTLIKAMRILSRNKSDIQLIIVGEGKERKTIEQAITAYRLTESIKLLGSVAYQKMPALFAAADIFVICSTHEGLPRSLMEAALSGKPIVGTQIGGVESLVKNRRSGLLVPVADAGRLADAMKELLEKKRTAKKWGGRARKEANSLLDFNRAVTRLIQSWRELLNETQK